MEYPVDDPRYWGGVEEDEEEKSKEEGKPKNLYKDKKKIRGDHVPTDTREICDREDEKAKIKESIDDVREGSPIDLYIYGVPGTGKTYTVHAVLKEEKNQYEDEFQYAWVNCATISPITPNQIYLTIAKDLGEKPKRGISAGEVYENHILPKAEEKPLIVVFDEADFLTKSKGTRNLADEILYKLYGDDISMFLLSNDFKWTGRCESRVSSRSHGNNLEFSTYTAEQLTNILKYLNEKCIVDGAVDEEILKKIADEVSTYYSSDTRKIKHILDDTVNLAMKDGKEKVEPEHVDKAFELLKVRELEDIIQKLDTLERIVLASYYYVHKIGMDTTTRNIYGYFNSLCTENGIEQLTQERMRHFLKRLEQINILYKQVDRLPKKGRTSYYFSDYSQEEIEKALESSGIYYINYAVDKFR